MLVASDRVMISDPMRGRKILLNNSLELGVGLLALAAGGYVLTTTILMVVECWTAVPFWDQWDNLILARDKLFWHDIPLDLPHWLFWQHNEHRIAVPRVSFAIDRFFFRMTNEWNFFCNLAVQGALAGWVVYTALRGVGWRISEKLLIIGAVSALLLSAMQWENLLWGFQIAFLGVDLAAFATFTAVAMGRPNVTRLVAAIGIESVAVYTLSSGMVVPFLAVPLAIWVRWPRRYVAVLGVAALALLGSYLYDYHTPSHVPDPMQAVARIGSVLSYVTNEIGDPFGMVFSAAQFDYPKNWGWLCGALGLALFAGFAVDSVRRREREGPVPILVAAALFVVGMELLIALGRVNAGESLSSRYSSPVLLFWAALVIIAMIRLRHGNLRFSAMAAILAVASALALYQPSFVALGRAWTLPRLEATTALLANVDDPEALVRVYPSPSVPRERAKLLRERHLSVFSEEWSDWIGTSLADHVRLSDPARCRGGIDQAGAVGASDPAGWRASGWASDAERQAVPMRVVIADTNGRVVGYGLSGFPRPDGSRGWRGHFRVAPTASVVAYALLDDGRTACSLGQWSGPA